MLTSLTMSTGAPYVQGTRPFHWSSQCFPKTSPMACGRRSQLTTSTTKVKSICSSAICLASTPFYPKSLPKQPIPYPKSYKNTSSSMDCQAPSKQTTALPQHLMNSPSSYSNITLITSPLLHTFPHPMASLSIKKRP